MKHLSFTTKQLFIGGIIALFTVGAIVVYQFSASNNFYAAVPNTPGQPVTSSAQPAGQSITHQVKNVFLEEQGAKEFFKWTNLNTANTGYQVKYLEEPFATSIFVKGQYKNDIGTFTQPAFKTTKSGKAYYIAQMPSNVNTAAKGLKSSKTLPDSGTTHSAFELQNIQKGKVYTFYVDTYTNGNFSAHSTHAVIFKGDDILAKSSLPYKDVDTGKWYYSYVSYLYRKGIIKAADTYNPNGMVNRAQMMVFVMKAIGKTPASSDAAYAAKQFEDVAENDWFAGELGYMARNGWIKGYPIKAQPGKFEFKAGNNVRRHEMLKILISAYGIDVSQLGKQKIFNDVPAGSWFAPYVEYAYNKGIISMNDKKTFSPERGINRAEIAKILSVAMQKLSSN